MTTTGATRSSGATQRTEFIPFRAGDGMYLTMLHVTDPAFTPSRGPVLLVHGLGVRAELWRPPIPHTFVDALIEAGYDAWLVNWRASIDLPPTAYTLDDAAVHDHPAAVRFVKEATGASSVKVVAQCQGATSMTMAAISGLLPDVSVLVGNGSSWAIEVKPWTRLKLEAFAPYLNAWTPSLSPKWGYKSEGPLSRVLRDVVDWTHPECDNPVCKMASFVYGAGHPAMWEHRNLDKATHDWIAREFGFTSMRVLMQIRASAKVGHLVPTGSVPGVLPDLAKEIRSDAKFVFTNGTLNKSLLPSGQVHTWQHFERLQPGRHRLLMFEGYSHLDQWWGRNAWRDVFPKVIAELED